MTIFSRKFRDALGSRWGVKIQEGLEYTLAPEPAGVVKGWEYPAHVRLTIGDTRILTLLDLESAARLRDELDRAIWETETLASVVVGRTYSQPVLRSF
jgi:hypothetical protein